MLALVDYGIGDFECGGALMARYLMFTGLFLSLASFGCSARLNDQGDNKRKFRILPIKRTAFYGSSAAWAVTWSGHLMSTNDAGQTWVRCEQPVGRFDAVSFIDAKQGWAVIDSVEVWSTNDGGQSWKTIGEVSRADGKFPGPLLTIRFIDESNGWIISSFGVWKTDDGGVQWREQAVDAGPNRSRGYLSDCYFVDFNSGWLTGSQGKVCKTEDGGRTWQSQNIAPGDGYIRDISFVNVRTGWLAIINGNKWDTGIYATEDGGGVWNPQSIAGKKLQILSVSFVSESEGWAAGIEVLKVSSGETSHAALLYTQNGGRDWSTLYTGQRSSIGERCHFANPLCGWLLVRSDQDDCLYRTSDSGKTWEESLRLPLIDEQIASLMHQN